MDTVSKHGVDRRGEKIDQRVHRDLANDRRSDTNGVDEAPLAPRTLVALPGAIKAGAILTLQRTVGNRAVQRLLALKRNSQMTATSRSIEVTAQTTIQRTVDEMANALWQAKQGKPLIAGDTAVAKLKLYGLQATDKSAVIAKYNELVGQKRQEARGEATGIVTWAELTSVLSGNSGGQSYYKWKGGDYPHVSVEWTSMDSNLKGPKRIKKIHVSFLRVDGPKYWWNAFSAGRGTYHETSGRGDELKAGMRDEANKAVEQLILPLHIDPAPIPATEPG